MCVSSEDDGEGAVEEKTDGSAGDVEVLEEAVEDAVGAENGFPGVAADEIADPERNDDELIEKIFANARVEGHEVGERIAEREREQRDAGGDAQQCGKELRRRRDSGRAWRSFGDSIGGR